MTPNELRIGNLFINAAGEVDEVVELSKQYVTGKEFVTPYATARGVELTDEWLIKMGFGVTGSIKSVDNIIWFERDRNDIWLLTEENGIILIKHIHEVQNLYYDLTHEELKLTQ